MKVGEKGYDGESKRNISIQRGRVLLCSSFWSPCEEASWQLCSRPFRVDYTPWRCHTSAWSLPEYQKDGKKSKFCLKLVRVYMTYMKTPLQSQISTIVKYPGSTNTNLTCNVSNFLHIYPSIHSYQFIKCTSLIFDKLYSMYLSIYQSKDFCVLGHPRTFLWSSL